MNKKILIALGVSLAINFAFIGFETAKVLYKPAFERIPPERPGFARMKDGPKDEKGPSMFKGPMMKAFKQAAKDYQKEMAEAKKEMEAALVADPFNTEKFKEALAKASAVRSSIDAAVQANMVEFISEMTPEERRRFADEFSRKKEHMDKARQERKEFRRDFRRGPHHAKPVHHQGKRMNKDFRRDGKKDFRRKDDGRPNYERRGSDKKSFDRRESGRSNAERQERRRPQQNMNRTAPDRSAPASIPADVPEKAQI